LLNRILGFAALPVMSILATVSFAIMPVGPMRTVSGGALSGGAIRGLRPRLLT
jgi:hypothetical protein